MLFRSGLSVGDVGIFLKSGFGDSADLRSVAHIMAVSRSAIILIFKSGNMFNGERTKFGTRFYDYGNVVSRKKVEKMKEFYKRNRYREVRRNFQKWK